MKRYLNKSLFYQGDSKIYLPLILVYLINYLVVSVIIGNYFEVELIEKLYYIPEHYYSDFNLIYGIENWIMMIVYYAICYLIIVGIFKRKKWSTLLAGPFSRLDIRKREVILMIINLELFMLVQRYQANIWMNY